MKLLCNDDVIIVVGDSVVQACGTLRNIKDDDAVVNNAGGGGEGDDAVQVPFASALVSRALLRGDDLSGLSGPMLATGVLELADFLDCPRLRADAARQLATLLNGQTAEAMLATLGLPADTPILSSAEVQQLLLKC